MIHKYEWRVSFVVSQIQPMCEVRKHTLSRPKPIVTCVPTSSMAKK